MNLRKRIQMDVESHISGMVGRLASLRGRSGWDGGVVVLRTNDSKFGDYTTNIALRIPSLYSSNPASQGEKSIKDSSRSARTISNFRQSPVEFAKDLADRLKNQAYLEKLEVKEPGFLNFFVKDEIIVKEVENVLRKDEFESKFSGQKVIIEFTDPNPFKEFHVGHLYSNSVGESISRLLEVVGAQVKRANYQGDVGLHVAKCIWGIKKVESGKWKVESIGKLSKRPLSERIEFLGTAYAAGAVAYETDEKAKEEISALNKEIYEKLDLIEEYQLGKKWSLDAFEQIYKRLGTKFDLYYFESEVGKQGVEIVRKNAGKVFIESQGAVIFPGEKIGLHNRVFITSQGLPTYEAKELGLAFKKREDFDFDVSVIVTGNEIVDYFKVLVAAIRQIDKNLALKIRHIAHGMVRMPGGKISSRLGDVISATDLLDEAKKRAVALAKLSSEKGQTNINFKFQISNLKLSSRSGLSSEQVAEQVAVGAVKYALLKGNISQDIKFSFDEALALEGNSGPYLQYTYARARSVLVRSQESEVRSERSKFSGWIAQEKELLRALVHFEEAVVSAAEEFSPNYLANFLFEVAQKFNTMYNNLRIIDAEPNERARRLFLTSAVVQVLQKGLNLLGIAAPERM